MMMPQPVTAYLRAEEEQERLSSGRRAMIVQAPPQMSCVYYKITFSIICSLRENVARSHFTAVYI